MCAVRVCTRTAAAEKMMIFGRYKMYSNDAITHGKIKWRSLLICWLIILAGYVRRVLFVVKRTFSEFYSGSAPMPCFLGRIFSDPVREAPSI